MRQRSSYALLGTASNVGKSLLTVALCRYLHRRGVKVAPFKSINIALNSWVADGGEMGLAQAQQAVAAGIAPDLHMNPVLLKPSSGGQVQYVVLGRVKSDVERMDSVARRDYLRKVIFDSYSRLMADHEVVLIEGSGSAAEMNLLENDLANLWIARKAAARCVLVSDIDRGGIFASIVGTLTLLSHEDRRRFDGFIVNKLDGDPAQFEDGLAFLEEKSGMRCLGVIPILRDLNLKDEDVFSLRTRFNRETDNRKGTIRIGVLELPHISNFSDFDLLSAEPTVQLEYLTSLGSLANFDLVVIPGTKSTLDDLEWIQRTGWAVEVRDFAKRGGLVAGICGGFQILGVRIEDPEGVERTSASSAEALGLLPVRTVMMGEKTTEQVRGKCIEGEMLNAEIEGYEVHMGRTDIVSADASPIFQLNRLRDNTMLSDGAIGRDGRVWGTYVHGLFDSDRFRLAFLNAIRKTRGLSKLHELRAYSEGGYEHEIDRWTDHVVKHLDKKFLDRLADAR
jgi:adenosylcobyric acid synthase